MIGRTISHYEIVEKLGEGGMGVVYKARDTRLGRSVAIKIVHSQFTRRFEHEAKAVSALNHPHICTLYDVGEHEGAPYLVMEYVEGQPLKGPLPAGEAVSYAVQICQSLVAAHKAGIIHRDLKPDNILLTGEGSVKVLDFGLAKLSGTTPDGTTLTSITGPGAVTGTASYMSPEQAQGEPVDARSDIFSFGAVLYELLSGRRAFRRESMGATLAAVITSEPPPLREAPSEVARIVDKMLAKKREDRYQSAEELLAALEAAAAPGLPLRSRRLWLGVAAALAIIAASVGWLDLNALWKRLLSGGAKPRLSSLAVLPVANLSGDPEQEYFADGMTDALITDLSKNGALKVISRTSVMQYKGVKKRLPEIARDLKVDTVLEASFVREAGRVRVTAQLIEAATDRHLWAENYERELSSILALQSEVARSIARTVGARLRPQEQARLSRARTVNPATYEAYLKGTFYLNKATQADSRKGVEFLRNAVENDPADPLAYAGLALGYVSLSHSSEAREDDLQRAKAAAQTALKLDDSLAEALLATGFVKGYYERNWEDAEQDIQRALDINPSLAMAHYHLAWYRVVFKRMQEAIEEHKRAKELDPFNPLHVAWLGEIYRLERRYAEATAEALKSIEMAPNFPPGHFVLGLIYRDQGRYDEAIAAIRKAGEASPGYRWALGPVYAAAGRRAEAQNLLAELKRQKMDPIRAFWRAGICAALGENDEAFQWLNYDRPHAWIPWVGALRGWGFDSLRVDPRFPDFLRRMNLPPLPGGA